MKQEKTFIKTNVKAKAVILFLVFALFCIFGILACGGENLPTSSAGDRLNDNNIVNTNSKNNINSNIPLFDINSPITNINSANPSYPKPNPEPKPEPEPEPTPNPNPDMNSAFPSDSYRNIAYHEGNGRNYISKTTNVSYKDTDTLSKIWTNLTSRFVIRAYIGELCFNANGDLYWSEKPSKILKKFEGGTIIKYKGGKYDGVYGIGGVYTYAISRQEANTWGPRSQAVKLLFNRNNDNGGKKGKIEVLVLNHGYSWNGYSLNGMYIHNENLLIVDKSNYNLIFGFQSYNQSSDDNLKKYFGDKTPEQNMGTLNNIWNYWNSPRVSVI